MNQPATSLLFSKKIDNDLLIKRSLLFGLISEGLFEDKNNLLYVVLKTISLHARISDSMLEYNLNKRFPAYKKETVIEMAEALTTGVAGTPPLVSSRKNEKDSRRPTRKIYFVSNQNLAQLWLSALESENSALKLINLVISDLEGRQ